MRFRFALTALVLCASATAGSAQPSAGSTASASEHVAMGDRDYSAMNAAAALKHYEIAIAAEPKHYEALYKAARSMVDLGESQSDAAKRTAMYRNAELHARRAVDAKPNDAEGHFHLARAIGRNALTMGSRDRVKYAGDVRKEALEALKYNPRHAGALHVMGVWNAEVMRLNGFSRMMAKNFLGGQVFGSASWKEAARYMEAAVAADPTRATHHLDAARIYRDMGDRAKARAHYQAVLNSPNIEANDAKYKAEATQALKAA